MSALRLVPPPDSAPRPRPRKAPAEGALAVSPIDRLLEHGTKVLSDTELVALVLQAGPSAGLAPATSILRDCGGLAGLPQAQPADVVCDGVGNARAGALLAAVELGRRLQRRELSDRKPLDRPAVLASYLNLRYRLRDQEVMGAVYLDTRQRLLFEKEIYRGTMCRAAVEPRAILKEALLHAAAGVILFHTHPSGDPSPSLEDLAFTRRMAEAGEAVGVRLVDHLILGGAGRWVSLKERGAW